MTQDQVQAISAQQFAEGLLAGLAAGARTEIRATQPRLHRAFLRVAQAAKEQHIPVNIAEFDYDPLYGLSRWLDKFLARAQRDLMITTPNPSYARIQIMFTPSEGKRMLKSIPNGDAFSNLSSRFWEELKA